MAKQSAGLVVYRMKGNDLEVLLVHPGGPFFAKKDVGAWSIPKGEFEGDETPELAARREFAEELGMPPPPGELLDLGTVKQKSGKTVYAWAVEGDMDVTTIQSNTFTMEWPPRSGQEQTYPEVDKARWFTLATASQKILPAQADLLIRLAEALNFTPYAPPEQATLF